VSKNSSIIIAIIATVIRYHDYALFGLSSGILSQNFMPNAEQSQQILLFFALFSLTTIARPLGSIIFGKIGDLIGRVDSIKISTLLAAISTLSIGLMPGYDAIGPLAVLMLFLMRMLFLTSLVGEVDAIKIYVIEKFKSDKHYRAVGLVYCMSQVGVLLASLAGYVTVLYQDDYPYLWRVNFIIGGTLGIILFSLRKNLQESEYFLSYKRANAQTVQVPMRTNLWLYKKEFILSILINGLLGGNYHFLIIFLNSFTANVLHGINKLEASMLNAGLVCSYGVGSLCSGYINDLYQRHVVSIIKYSLLLIILLLIWAQIISNMNYLYFMLHIAIVFFVPFYAIPLNLRTQGFFNASVKMRMYSLSHSIGSMLLSSTTPFFCMLIWNKFSSYKLVLAYFLCQLLLLLYLNSLQMNQDNRLDGK
jgi:MFS family permease